MYYQSELFNLPTRPPKGAIPEVFGYVQEIH